MDGATIGDFWTDWYGWDVTIAPKQVVDRYANLIPLTQEQFRAVPELKGRAPDFVVLTRVSLWRKNPTGKYSYFARNSDSSLEQHKDFQFQDGDVIILQEQTF